VSPATICIVTPSFNRKEYLGATMDSVLGQDYPNLEYVLVDGGSTDGSAEVIAARAGDLAWWVSEPDSGPWEAINKGFGHTTSEVMGWLGSDDLLMPWTLAVVGELFAQFPEIEWLTTLFPLACDEEGRSVACSPRAPSTREGFFHGENLPEAGWPATDFIMQEATFWRRSLWDRTGGYVAESLKLAADFELWARFHLADAKLYGVPTPLASFRQHGNQKSLRERAAYIDEARNVLLQYGGKLPTPPSPPRMPLWRRALVRVLPRRVRLVVGRAVERLAGLDQAPPTPAPQAPKLVHDGAGKGWRVEGYEEALDDA
jgi:glycosyltransferase involved in cell wall biosynthesis